MDCKNSFLNISCCFFGWRLSLNLNWNIEYLITPRWWTPLWTCQFTGSLAPPSERHCSRNWWHWREKCPEPRHKELGWVNQIIQIFTLIWRDKCFMSYAQSIQVQVIVPFFLKIPTFHRSEIDARYYFAEFLEPQLF